MTNDQGPRTKDQGPMTKEQRDRAARFYLPVMARPCFYLRVRGTSWVFKEWRWLAVLLWMLIIFSASSDAMSSGHTSRIIGPIVRWLFPNVSDEAVARIVFI